MTSLRLRGLLLPALVTLLVASSSTASQLEDREGPVTPANLIDREHLWPYQTSVRESFLPPNREQPLPVGRLGVLIRVLENHTARIDFGRLGRYELPVAATDLVERANRVREDEIRKLAPNFTLAIGTRLVAPHGDGLRTLSASTTRPVGVFACIFADPLSDRFADQVAGLRDSRADASSMTLLVPQGGHDDAVVAARLRALGWGLPFVSKRFAAAETKAQLGEAPTVPTLLVQSAEGRLLEQKSLR